MSYLVAIICAEPEIILIETTEMVLPRRREWRAAAAL
jgi:hypothetical protein